MPHVRCMWTCGAEPVGTAACPRVASRRRGRGGSRCALGAPATRKGAATVEAATWVPSEHSAAAATIPCAAQWLRLVPLQTFALAPAILLPVQSDAATQPRVTRQARFAHSCPRREENMQLHVPRQRHARWLPQDLCQETASVVLGCVHRSPVASVRKQPHSCKRHAPASTANTRDSA